MTEKEVLSLFKYRVLKENNNYLFTNVQNMEIIEEIPDKCNLSFTKSGIAIPYAIILK